MNNEIIHVYLSLILVAEYKLMIYKYKKCHLQNVWHVVQALRS